MIIAISLIILIISFYLILTFYKIVFLHQAPFIQSSNKKIDLAILEILKLKDIKTVYELGCGDAKFLRRLKRRNPKLNCIGLEHNLFPYAIAKIQNIFLKHKIIIKKG